jgi:intracellular septation protein
MCANSQLPSHTYMKALFDFFPLLLFFAAFKLYDIYTATAIAIAATFLQVAFVWFKYRRFEATHIVTLIVISFFGGLTLFFHNDAFIMWKPSVVNWIFSVIVLGSVLINRSVIKALMGKQLELPDHIWTRLSIAWGVFFLLMGLLNMYVAFYYQPELAAEVRRETWVNFKVFWMLGLTLVFSVVQMLFIAKYIDPEAIEKSKKEAETE